MLGEYLDYLDGLESRIKVEGVSLDLGFSENKSNETVLEQNIGILEGFIKFNDILSRVKSPKVLLGHKTLDTYLQESCLKSYEREWSDAELALLSSPSLDIKKTRAIISSANVAEFYAVLGLSVPKDYYNLSQETENVSNLHLSDKLGDLEKKKESVDYDEISRIPTYVPTEEEELEERIEELSSTRENVELIDYPKSSDLSLKPRENFKARVDEFGFKLKGVEEKKEEEVDEDEDEVETPELKLRDPFNAVPKLEGFGSLDTLSTMAHQSDAEEGCESVSNGCEVLSTPKPLYTEIRREDVAADALVEKVNQSVNYTINKIGILFKDKETRGKTAEED